MNASPTGSIHAEEDEAASNPLSSYSEEEPLRRVRREQRYATNSNDLRVEIPKFESKLDPYEFLEWVIHS